MPKLLITGSAGFVGFHLLTRLIGTGYEIDGIDNLNDYYDPGLKTGRLAASGIERNALDYGVWMRSAVHSSYRFIQLDLAEREAMKQLFGDENYSAVIHLAAQAGVRYSLENPHAYVDSNLQGFVNILEGCRQSGVSHLIYASSSSVYGGNTKVPFNEDDPVDTPVSLYAATKRANELMAHTYSHLYGLAATGLRFFTVYGPWGRPDMAYFLFTKAILENRPIKIFNNGDMQRDFTYVDDIVEGIVRLLEAGPVANETNRLFNIGNNRPEHLMEMIGILEELLGKQAQKEFLPMQPGDVYQTWADVDRLNAAVGYNPSTSLKTGLAAFVDWYRAHYG